MRYHVVTASTVCSFLAAAFLLASPAGAASQSHEGDAALADLVVVAETGVCHDPCILGVAMNPMICEGVVPAVCAGDPYCCESEWDQRCIFEVATIGHDLSCGTCGDGNLDLSETCDDGNTVDGDQCSQFCALECHDVCVEGPSMSPAC